VARINIEDSLFKDQRWWKLIIRVGCEYKALGYLTKAWILAQEHWIEFKGVPPKAWPPELDVLIEVQLAEKLDDGLVYVKGSKTAFLWLEQRANAGRKGGKIARQAVAKRVEAVAKHSFQPAKPPTPTPTLSPSSPSNSSSRSKKKRDGTPSESATAQALIAGYCERFKARWGINPEIRGKDTGIARRLSKDLNSDKLELYLDAFFHIPDAWLVKAKHPLSALETKLNEVAVFASSGKFTTNKQAHQADDMATNALLLQQVRDGKI